MKKRLIAIALLTGSAFTGVANAADGTINFTGNITDAACTVSASTATQTVAMGTVSSGSMTTVGASSAPTRFNITLSACPATATSAAIKFDGPSDTMNSSLLALTNVPGVATGVAIGLYEADSSTLIPVGSASAKHTLTATGNNTFDYYAKYVSTNTTIVAGTASAVSNFTVVYN